jgi:hypothetical protein
MAFISGFGASVEHGRTESHPFAMPPVEPRQEQKKAGEVALPRVVLKHDLIMLNQTML